MQAAPSSRLRSLDVFRGITIAGMILVNSPGGPESYAPLDHAAWNGLTPTDLIFPFFVFIVGVSLVFSLQKRLAQGESTEALAQSILKRFLIIFGIGLLLNGFPYYNLTTIRIPGVLQRIAFCYLAGGLLFLWTNTATQIGVLMGSLTLYWWLMTHIHVPGFGPGILTKEGSLASHLDRLLLAGHLYRPEYDPEGLLSTLPAVGTVLIGTLTGLWLKSKGAPARKITGLIEAGVIFLLAGWRWGAVFPINKALWTSSYVLVTGGVALLFLAACYGIIEMRGWTGWAWPFEVFGLNAIAAYVLHVLFLKVQNKIPMALADGTVGNIRLYITEHLFSPWLSPKNASLAYASCYTLLWFVVFWNLYRRKVFIKI